MPAILAYLLAFVTAIGVDYVYSRWIIALTRRHRTSACCYSAAITLLGGLSTFLFLDDYFTLLPSALGHALGTALAMRRAYDNRPHD